jgi:hypothetical protein
LPFLKWVRNNTEECNNILSSVYNRRRYLSHFFVHFNYGEIDKIIDAEERRKFLSQKFHPSFISETEYGIGRVFGIVPIDFPHWRQYDNIIDYYSEPSGKNHVKWLDRRCGIYPFNVCMHLKKGKQPVGNLGEHPDGSQFNIAVGRWTKNSPPTMTPELVKQALEKYHCHIPESILLWTHYLDLFRNWEATISELRPALYTYWS